jgi:hypothetical protein
VPPPGREGAAVVTERIGALVPEIESRIAACPADGTALAQPLGDSGGACRTRAPRLAE